MEVIDIDSLLDEDISSGPETIPASDVRVPIRFSHSTRLLMRGCERKYYLTRYKVLNELDLPEADSNKNNTHLDFGSALGVGVQALLEFEDIERAIWEMLLVYNWAYETNAKNIISLVTALQSFHAQWNYEEWEFISGEASFKIVLNEDTGDYSCGYIDAIVRNRITDYYTVIEIKTTGSKMEDLRPMYQNSDQGVGYSVVLDQVVSGQSTFHVMYIVLQLKYNDIRPTWHFLPFLKTRKSKLEFLMTQQVDYEYACKLEELDYWPMRGSHCTSWNRTCHLFGVCDLDTIQDLPFMPARPEDDWDYVFNLEELIKEQMS